MSTQAVAHSVPQRTPFLKSRLGSFLAVVPLTFWVVDHLWNNLAVLRGGEAWQAAVTEYRHPFSMALSFLISLVPLLIHTAWGLARLLSFKPNLGAYPNYGNLKYILQRISAVGVLGFVGAHTYLAFLHPRISTGRPEQFAEFASEMRWNAPTLIVYLLGTLGTAYHISNGLQGFAMGWGLVASERSMRRFEPFSILLFLVLLAMSWTAIFAIYSAGAAYPPALAPQP